LITPPEDGGYYGPSHAILRRVASEVYVHKGEKLVATSKAYLYDEPSLLGRHKGYVIKGDYVKPIKVSGDLKFWQIEFATKDGRLLKMWIDCHDIDFCAK
jgi:hypothetical protein